YKRHIRDMLPGSMPRHLTPTIRLHHWNIARYQNMFRFTVLTLGQYIMMLQNPQLSWRMFSTVFRKAFHFQKTVFIGGQVIILTDNQSRFLNRISHRACPWQSESYSV